MSKRILLMGLVAVAFLFTVWALREKRAAPSVPNATLAPQEGGTGAAASPREKTTGVMGGDVTGAKDKPVAPDGLESTGPKANTAGATRLAEVEKLWKEQLSAPISFYGKIVDEADLPVSGASVELTWNDLPPDNETMNYTGENFTPFAFAHEAHGQATSDAQGLFSLLDKKGKRLCVSVAKPGFYSTGAARLQCFEYGDPLVGIFRPDPSNPIVFRLRKKGPGVDLITSQLGVRPDLGVRAPLDGTPVRVDLMSRKVGGEGPLEISQNKPDYAHWQQATQWSFRMALTDGGFVQQEEEFPFEAPETGYQPVVDFTFRNSETNWTTGLKRQFYIVFGNPRRYGRLVVESAIEMEGARLTYFINPAGSRYLEPK